MALAAGTELNTLNALNPDIVSAFRERGHVLTPALLSPEEVHIWYPRIGQAVTDYKAEVRDGVYNIPLEQRDTYAKAFIQIENIWARNETVRPFSLARRFGKIAAELLGVDGVRMYHDQALFKEARGGYTPWHQDQFYWPLDTTNTVTMWMPLIDVGCEAGTLVFADGSHRYGALGDLAISDQSETHFRNEIRRLGLRLSINEMRAGDATWHYGWTLHKAPGNALDHERPVMTIIFFADGTRVGEIRHEKHLSDQRKWLRELPPGALAESELNPLVWHRSMESAA